MMKILIISDSHGHHDLLRRAIGQEAPIDMLIHAGDVEGNLEKILGPKVKPAQDDRIQEEESKEEA